MYSLVNLSLLNNVFSCLSRFSNELNSLIFISLNRDFASLFNLIISNKNDENTFN